MLVISPEQLANRDPSVAVGVTLSVLVVLLLTLHSTSERTFYTRYNNTRHSHALRILK